MAHLNMKTGVCAETAVINGYAKPLAMGCLVCLQLDIPYT